MSKAIDKATAKATVETYLSARYPDHGKDRVAYDEAIEKDYGWVMFFNHRDFVVHGNRKKALAGNGPVLVEKASGAIHQFGTAEPLWFYLQQFEHEHNAKR